MLKTRIINPQSKEFNSIELNIRNRTELVSKPKYSRKSFQKVFTSQKGNEYTASIKKYSRDKVLLSIDGKPISSYMFIEDIERVLACYNLD